MAGRTDDPARVDAARNTPGRAEGNSISVGGKLFVFFRTPRPDAVDAVTGERYADVIVLWVESESDKLALVQDANSPLFTTDRASTGIPRCSCGAGE
jgi:hypothetical protein